MAAKIGAGIKYNLKKDWLEEVSLSYFGFSLEFSRQSYSKWQVYIGVDAGVSAGIGIGGKAGVKGGWMWQFWTD